VTEKNRGEEFQGILPPPNSFKLSEMLHPLKSANDSKIDYVNEEVLKLHKFGNRKRDLQVHHTSVKMSGVNYFLRVSF